MTPPPRPTSPESPPPSGAPGGGEDGCAAARRALLSADPDELRGRPGTALGRHLEDCDACRELAARLRAALGELDAWLDSPGRLPDPEAVVAAAHGDVRRAAGSGQDERGARAGSRVPQGPGVPATGSGAERSAAGGDGAQSTAHDRGRGTPGWKGTLRWVVPAAAAAGLVGLLVLRNGAVPGGRPGLDAPAPDARVALSGGSPDLDLEVPPDTDAAVLATGDPDITVIWFLGGDR